MHPLASFTNFCNASEHFLSSLCDKPLAESEAHMAAYYCKEILALLQPTLDTKSTRADVFQEATFLAEIRNDHSS